MLKILNKLPLVIAKEVLPVLSLSKGMRQSLALLLLETSTLRCYWPILSYGRRGNPLMGHHYRCAPILGVLVFWVWGNERALVSSG
jgi:hypothetical protein